MTAGGHRAIVVSSNTEAMEAVAVVSGMAQRGGGRAEADRARRGLSRFRADLRGCLTARGDELFELADAVLCGDGPVRDLAGLSLVPGHRRGHGAMALP